MGGWGGAGRELRCGNCGAEGYDSKGCKKERVELEDGECCKRGEKGHVQAKCPNGGGKSTNTVEADTNKPYTLCVQTEDEYEVVKNRRRPQPVGGTIGEVSARALQKKPKQDKTTITKRFKVLDEVEAHDPSGSEEEWAPLVDEPACGELVKLAFTGKPRWRTPQLKEG